MSVLDLEVLSQEIGAPETEAVPPTLASWESEATPTVQAPRGVPLPDWVDAAVFCNEPHAPPPEIIRGVLHQGCKLVLGGSSKACKSWALLDLALSVSTGLDWLRFQTTKSKVLFVNLELKPFSIHARLKAISEAKGVAIPGDGQLCLWNLRGYSAPYEVLLPRLAERIKGFGLVILDPSCKLLGQADANSARDIAALLNGIECLSETTGAASAFSAHFAKGLASSKEAIDRISGSGVFARDPDAIITLTALQTPDADGVETILRSFPPQAPFAVQWECPLMRVADEMDPGDLKRPASRTKPRPTAEQVLGLFRDCPGTPRAGLLTAVQLRSLFDTHGWDRNAAPAVRDQLEADGKLKVHHGPHNKKMVGLPAVVDAFEKQQAEADTILEQTALPKRQRKGRK